MASSHWSASGDDIASLKVSGTCMSLAQSGVADSTHSPYRLGARPLLVRFETRVGGPWSLRRFVFLVFFIVTSPAIESGDSVACLAAPPVSGGVSGISISVGLSVGGEAIREFSLVKAFSTARVVSSLTSRSPRVHSKMRRFAACTSAGGTCKSSKSLAVIQLDDLLILGVLLAQIFTGKYLFWVAACAVLKQKSAKDLEMAESLEALLN
ncbi:hypothetical protein BDW75DRAFT_189132 [Aspergillus navahoensis]